MLYAVGIDPTTLQEMRFLTADEDEMIECLYCRCMVSKAEAKQTTDQFLICPDCFKENMVECDGCGRVMELDLDTINDVLDGHYCNGCYDDMGGADGLLAVMDESVNVQYAEGV